MSIIKIITFLHIIFTVLLLCHPYTWNAQHLCLDLYWWFKKGKEDNWNNLTSHTRVSIKYLALDLLSNTRKHHYSTWEQCTLLTLSPIHLSPHDNMKIMKALVKYLRYNAESKIIKAKKQMRSCERPWYK